MLSFLDPPSCIERIGRRRKTISSAQQSGNERGVFKATDSSIFHFNTSTFPWPNLRSWQLGSHFHRLTVEYITLQQSLMKFIQCQRTPVAAFITLALCPASLHELKSILSKWRAGWSWTTARIICRAFSSTSALSEARKGYQTPAEVVKSVWIWFMSSVDLHHGNKWCNLWSLVLTLQHIKALYCGETASVEAWSIYCNISTALAPSKLQREQRSTLKGRVG